MFCPTPAPFLLQKQWFATCLCSPLHVKLATGRQIVLHVESSGVLRKKNKLAAFTPALSEMFHSQNPIWGGNVVASDLETTK